jgi:hypothetical protein
MHDTHFYPITVWVEDKRDIPHFPVCKPFMKVDVETFKTCACGLNVRYGDCNVTKASSRFLVSGSVTLKVWITLSSVVMG